LIRRPTVRTDQASVIEALVFKSGGLGVDVLDKRGYRHGHKEISAMRVVSVLAWKGPEVRIPRPPNYA
jgi:hypothetical protein